MFFEEVEIVPSVFDKLPLIGINRIPTVQGIFKSVTDCFLGYFNFCSSSVGSKSAMASL
jgi:hypothetical protein